MDISVFDFGRISTRALAQLARRLGTALEAGIDLRRVWTGEAARARGHARAVFGAIRDVLARGDSLSEALDGTGRYFPPLFRTLTRVGETTGHLPEVFQRLADHYDNQLRLRRLFLAAIAWPVAELAIAVVVIGLLILVVGIIGDSRGMHIDPLGLGLVGPRGLMIYLIVVAAAVASVAAVVQAARRGLVWTRPIQRLLMRLPVLGGCLETLALARLTWSLHLMLDTQIDVREAVRASLESTHNARLTDRAGRMDDVLAAGSPIAEAFAAAGVFPAELVAGMAVGEESGRLVEALALLSRQYHDRARAALATLTTLAGMAVWAAIAAIIIALIFRLAMFYIGILNSAMSM